MNFGELADETSSFRIMDEAIDAGINFFDTAGVYGGPQWPDMEKGYGVSEEIIGRWLAQGGFHGNCWAGSAALQHTDDRKLMGKCSTHNKDGAEDIQMGPR
jgi:predicted aldo/keto reductase-like oxidoreductase